MTNRDEVDLEHMSDDALLDAWDVADKTNNPSFATEFLNTYLLRHKYMDVPEVKPIRDHVGWFGRLMIKLFSHQ